MKNALSIQTLLLLISSQFIFAQDLIMLKSGGETLAIIRKIGIITVEYVRYDNQGGPIYEILKEDIFSIKYENGTEDYFGAKIADKPEKNVLPFEGIFLDIRDSITYKWIKIAKQVWMCENLKYDIGDSPCINNECDKCGRYYRYEDALSACSVGWHLPSDYDWMELEIEAGMNESEASKIGWRGTNSGQANDLLLKGSTGIDLRMCGFVYQKNLSKKKPSTLLISKENKPFIGHQQKMIFITTWLLLDI